MMRRRLGAVIGAFVVISASAAVASPENDAVAALKARLGADVSPHLMTTRQWRHDVAVCGYAGHGAAIPAKAAYSFPPGDRGFVWRGHRLVVEGEVDRARFAVLARAACPGMLERPHR